MAVPDPLDDYQLSYQEFYSEIPGSIDYLNDIDHTIYDEHDNDTDSNHGLSAQQVSEIARDSMTDTTGLSQITVTEDPQLFPLDEDAH